MEIEDVLLTWTDKRIANEFPGFVRIPLFKNDIINKKGEVYSLKHEKGVLINGQKKGKQWFYILRKNRKSHSATREDLIICAFGRFDEMEEVSLSTFALKVERLKSVKLKGKKVKKQRKISYI